MLKKWRESLTDLKSESKEELIETKKMIELLWKSRKGQLSEQEIEQIKGQSLDIVRLIFLGAIFAIPFSGIFIIILVKGANKIGIRLMPSAFFKK